MHMLPLYIQCQSMHAHVYQELWKLPSFISVCVVSILMLSGGSQGPLCATSCSGYPPQDLHRLWARNVHPSTLHCSTYLQPPPPVPNLPPPPPPFPPQDLTEQMISQMVLEIKGSYKISYHANGPDEAPVEIDFTPPW